MNRLIPIFLAAGLAHAQPAEDPGLAESPPPPPPAKIAPPATSTTAPAATTTSTSAPARSTAVTMAPAERPAPPPSVDESVSVKTEWVAPDKDEPKEGGELDQHVAAPTVTGGVGLLRTQTGSIGNQGSFRIGLHAGIFQQDQLVAGASSGNPGDSNTRFTGDLTISYTPWKYLEAYFGLYNTSNQNARTDPGRTDPQLLTSLADFALGLKGRYPVARFVDLALRVEVKFLDSVNASGIEGAATNGSVDAIASFDLRHIAKAVPLRFHLNFGYLYDNSVALLPGNQCATSTANDACIRSRAVQEFAYGIGSQRLRLALATDAPLQRGSVGVQPFFEYHLETALGSGDPVMARVLPTNNGQIIQYLTLGLRVRPFAGLILDAGLDVGLQSPGWVYGPPLPEWNLLLGAAYAYEFSSRKTKVVTRTVTRETAQAPTDGRVRGMVRDAATRRPLGGVSIKYVNRMVTGQLSSEDGAFVSYGFSPGAVTLEVARDDYEPVKVDVRVAQRSETPVELLLVPKPPPAGQFRVRVSDPAGGPIGMATVRLRGEKGIPVDADNDGSGAFSAKLTAGEYAVDVYADNFLATSQKINVTAGQVQAIAVTLPKKPPVARVSLKPDEIALKGSLKFAPDNQLTPADQLLLDEVADLLIKNASIKKLRIESHTDNKLDPEKGLQQTKERAIAVAGYLQKRGVDGARLDAQGLGSSQPLAPNLTAANRARNRRVNLKIVQMD
jgi:outer membrane protein OmpA-like peptidoglycan-associated protein